LRHIPNTRYKKPIIIKNQIKEFYSKIKQHSLNNIICIDETSINSFMIRIKCYEELGKRCIVKTENQDVLDEIPIHIYKNIIKGAYDRNEKYIKRSSTKKRKSKKYLN